MTPVRVLMPQRLDVLGRSMDTNIVTQWLALADVCDLVLWGPGLDGFIPGMPLDEVAEHVDADVVLLADLHHAIPGLWSELWAGAERSRRPVVYNLGDWGSEVGLRRAVWERVRPAGVLLCYSPSALTPFGYDDLVDRLGTELLVVPMGYDAVQFHPPAPGAERDIDLLLAGCAVPEIYPNRHRIMCAARRLAGEFNVVDLDHPGYWESHGVKSRGQAHYADLLRRSRTATTGTGYDVLMRKYWEVAGCGTIGIGDLPLGEPDAARFTDGTLVVDPAWDEERIAHEIRTLLSDRERCDRLSRNAVEAMRGCDHRDRAGELLEALGRLVREPNRSRRPRPFRIAPVARKLCAAPEPAAVPSVRGDWIDIWTRGGETASRTRRVEAALAGDEDVAVIALDPDAALDADALVLATACRASGQVVIRPGAVAPGDLFATEWSAVAAPRAALEQALAGHRGRSGLEAALVAVGGEVGVQILAGSGYADPTGALMRASVRPSLMAIERAIAQALEQQRFTTASELLGLRAAAGAGPAPALVSEGTALVGGGPAVARAHAIVPGAFQDPECELVEGGAFTRFDPSQPGDLETIAAHAALPPDAPPLHVGIPISAGLAVTDALAMLAELLQARGVDVNAGPDLVILERPLFEAELAWLAAELAPSPGLDDLPVAA